MEERSEFWEHWVTEYLGAEGSECRFFLPGDLVTIKMMWWNSVPNLVPYSVLVREKSPEGLMFVVLNIQFQLLKWD